MQVWYTSPTPGPGGSEEEEEEAEELDEDDLLAGSSSPAVSSVGLAFLVDVGSSELSSADDDADFLLELGSAFSPSLLSALFNQG